MRRCSVLAAALFFVVLAYTQQPATLSKEVQKYVRVQSTKVVLTHVRVVDGTGRAPTDDQNVMLEGGKITGIQPGADVAPAKDAAVISPNARIAGSMLMLRRSTPSRRATSAASSRLSREV